MLKNILRLDGAQQLSKNDQKEINGGVNPIACDCPFLLAKVQEAAANGTTYYVHPRCMYCMM